LDFYIVYIDEAGLKYKSYNLFSLIMDKDGFVKCDDVSLKSYPKSLRQSCTICSKLYSTGQLISIVDCGLHSVHKHCEDKKLEGECPTCQNSSSVFPIPEWEYIHKHHPEDMIITGFGRHQLNDSYYILLTFDPEKREMYWFPLYSLLYSL
jgi:hypothetical protein